MKENWFAILMFSVIFGILGFLMGRVTCTTCCVPTHSCSPTATACCAPGEGNAECVWVEAGEDGGSGVRIITKSSSDMSFSSDGDVDTIIEQLEIEDFVGDTTITSGNSVIKMSKSEDGEIEVNVEMTEVAGEGSAEKVMVKTIKVLTDEE